MYENDGGNLIDRASQWGLLPAAEDSWCGSWADYDRDGDLDLFVGRGYGSSDGLSGQAALQDRLFRNDLNLGGGFVDVSAAAGIDQNSGRWDLTLGSAWCDFDQDGDVDLFTTRAIDPLPLGGPGAPAAGSLLYVNQGDGTFVESSDTLIDTNIVYADGAVWTDFDQDGDLDLVVSLWFVQGFAGLQLFRNNAGSLEWAQEYLPVTQGISTIGVSTFDHDLDGMVDLLGIPAGSQDVPMLFTAWKTTSSEDVRFSDHGALSGLEAAQTGGMAVVDFNDDGDQDVMLGRPEVGPNSKLFYRNIQPGGADAPANNFLALTLRARNDDGSWDGGNNLYGVGATVTVSAPAGNPVFTVSQVVDGGSGRGSQSDPTRLTFGLGPQTSADVTVRWPDRATTTTSTTTINDAGSPFEIRDDHDPEIVASTVSGHVEPEPGGKTDYVISWEVRYSSNPEFDRVQVRPKAGSPPLCSFAQFTAWATDVGVTHSVVPLSSGRQLHTLRINNILCVAPCNIEYRVISGFEDSARTNTSAWKSFKILACAQ
jgi:hypothetical protein